MAAVSGLLSFVPFQILNGRSGMSRHNLYKIQKIIAQESPYRRFRSHQSGQRSNPSKPILAFG